MIFSALGSAVWFYCYLRLHLLSGCQTTGYFFSAFLLKKNHVSMDWVVKTQQCTCLGKEDRVRQFWSKS